jgi:hypothetical protein
MNPANPEDNHKETQEAFREAAHGASDPHEAKGREAMAEMNHPATANAAPTSPRPHAPAARRRSFTRRDSGCRATAAEIARSLSMQRAGGGFTGACPSCGYRSGFTVEDRDGKTLVKCHAGGCSQADVIGALRKHGLWGGADDGRAFVPRQRTPRAPASEKPDDAEKTEWARRIWRATHLASGTPVETYLRARGYRGPLPTYLRFHPALKHKDGPERHPGMVAAVMIENKLVAVHRTYLRPDGSGKAGLSDDKLSLGPIGGGAVHLHIGPLPHGGRLAVSEGIETGLAVMQQAGIPTWAALSAGGIKKLILPPIEVAPEIIIAADNDQAGLKAANDAARRWHAEGRRVRIAVPENEGEDFADVIWRAA